MSFRGLHFEEVPAVAHADRRRRELPVLVHRRVRLGHEEVFLTVGRQEVDLVGHHAVVHLAVRRLDEAELVDARERAHRRDQADVRAFRRLDGADAAVVARMHVANLETGAITRQTSRPEGA